MSDLLSDNPQERNDAVKRILNTAQSNLVKKNKRNDRNPNRTVKNPNNSIQLKEEAIKKISQKFLKLTGLGYYKVLLKSEEMSELIMLDKIVIYIFLKSSTSSSEYFLECVINNV